MNPLALISNPTAGRGRGAKVTAKLVEQLSASGLDFTLQTTAGPKDATRLARQAIGGCRAVVIIGGDGTAHEAAQALARTETPLAVVPAGSGNDFASALGMPSRIEDMARILDVGRVREIDLGRINGKYFVNAVGIGLDATINESTREITWLRGLPAYFWAMLQTLWSYEPVMLEVEADTREIIAKALLFAVGNGTSVGGGFRLTPKAELDDGKLDITMVEPMALRVLFWHLPKVFTGNIERVKYAATLQSRNVIVSSPEPLPAHVDGEVINPRERSFHIEVVPRAIRVITPMV